ncbi:hypothetical protein [Sporosarcina sp. FSL K6-3457]|uniref:hypothetical protein n=1 Tax=Sporosarcina sp. FSL K6-3457 TaxID=2978204 RepID=UPI0030F6CB33
MQIGRRIYYDLTTGNVIIDTRERQGAVVPTTVVQDRYIYKSLSERSTDSYDVVELPYGFLSQDFAECDGYRVNPETKKLEFSYPDPNEPEAPPIYEAPLSEKVASLEQENQLLKAQNNALSDRADFIEDVVAEMAIQVYQ